MDVERKTNEIVENYIKKKLEEAQDKIDGIVGQTVKLADVIEMAEEANSYIKFIAGEDDQLYDAYKYHVILTNDGDFHVIQGREFDTDPKGKP